MRCFKAKPFSHNAANMVQKFYSESKRPDKILKMIARAFFLKGVFGKEKR